MTHSPRSWRYGYALTGLLVVVGLLNLVSYLHWTSQSNESSPQAPNSINLLRVMEDQEKESARWRPSHRLEHEADAFEHRYRQPEAQQQYRKMVKNGGQALAAISQSIVAQTSKEPEDPNCIKLDKSHREKAFINATVCYRREDVVQILIDLVYNITTVFADHNVTCFLESGTLLGAYRDHGVIKHDTDADIGIDEAGYQYLRDHTVVFPPEYHFSVFNSTVQDTATRDPRLPIRLVHKASALYVDVFVFLDWMEKENHLVGPLASWCFFNCVNCPRVDEGGKALRVPYNWIYPVTDCQFEKRIVKCPKETEQYLKHMYGPGYKIPQRYH